MPNGSHSIGSALLRSLYRSIIIYFFLQCELVENSFLHLHTESFFDRRRCRYMASSSSATKTRKQLGGSRLGVIVFLRFASSSSSFPQSVERIGGPQKNKEKKGGLLKTRKCVSSWRRKRLNSHSFIPLDDVDRGTRIGWFLTRVGRHTDTGYSYSEKQLTQRVKIFVEAVGEEVACAAGSCVSCILNQRARLMSNFWWFNSLVFYPHFIEWNILWLTNGGLMEELYFKNFDVYWWSISEVVIVS